MSLSEERREALRERIRSNLPFAKGGSIPLMARAWAVAAARHKAVSQIVPNHSSHLIGLMPESTIISST
jgi:hypothetical protein